MNDKERMLCGKLYNPYKVNNPQWEKGKSLLKEFNDLNVHINDESMSILKKAFHNIGENTFIIPPLYYDHADNTSIGHHCFINTEFMMIGEGKINIGNDVYIGPRVSLYTATHPIDAFVRNQDLEISLPITIGNNVWIGGNVVINPGITIGNNVVIGSGSVITKDIEDNVVAAGNPCKIKRRITQEDHEYWYKQYLEYIKNNE